MIIEAQTSEVLKKPALNIITIGSDARLLVQQEYYFHNDVNPTDLRHKPYSSSFEANQDIDEDIADSFELFNEALYVVTTESNEEYSSAIEFFKKLGILLKCKDAIAPHIKVIMIEFTNLEKDSRIIISEPDTDELRELTKIGNRYDYVHVQFKRKSLENDYNAQVRHIIRSQF